MSCSRVRSDLVDPTAHAGPEARSRRERLSRNLQVFVGDGPAESNRGRLFGADPIAEKKQLGGPSETNDPRQKVGGAHIGTRQPDPREEEMERGRSREESQIRGKCDDRTRSCCGAVHCGDDRDGQFSHALDNGSGHAGELEQLVRTHCLQRSDDLVDIATGAKTFPAPGDDQCSAAPVVGELAEQVAEVGVYVEGEGVEHLGSIKYELADAVSDRKLEMVPVLGQTSRSLERHSGKPSYSSAPGRRGRRR